MKRNLIVTTAAFALAASFGMPGLAHAQEGAGEGVTDAVGVENAGVITKSLDVSLGMVRNAEVVGENREEIGEVQELVISPENQEVDPVDTGVDPVDAPEGAVQGTAPGATNQLEPRVDPVDTAAETTAGQAAGAAGRGIYAVVNVSNGWFEDDRQIVVPIRRFIVVEEGSLMLPDVTQETIGTEFEDYNETDWAAVDYERFGTFGEAYEGYGWDW